MAHVAGEDEVGKDWQTDSVTDSRTQSGCVARLNGGEYKSRRLSP